MKMLICSILFIIMASGIIGQTYYYNKRINSLELEIHNLTIDNTMTISQISDITEIQVIIAEAITELRANQNTLAHYVALLIDAKNKPKWD